MAVAKVYGKGIRAFVGGEIDYTADTIKVALLDQGYVPDQDAHEFVSDLTNELTGGGYARVTLTAETAVYDGPTNTLSLGCADVTFPSLTGTNIRFAVVFKDTGTAGTSPLICFMDFGSGQTITSQDFVIQIPASGIVQFTAA